MIAEIFISAAYVSALGVLDSSSLICWCYSAITSVTQQIFTQTGVPYTVFMQTSNLGQPFLDSEKVA